MTKMKIIKRIYNYLSNMIGKMDPIKHAKRIGVKIGDNCRLTNSPNWGSEPYLITIGNHVLISNDVMFLTHDGSTFVFREKEEYKDIYKFGKIEIGNNCFIGARSIILPNVKIGNDCIIGAGSVVSKSIPDGEVWAGVPAHKISLTEEYAKKCQSNKLDYDADEIKRHPKEEMQRAIQKSADKKNRFER